MQEHDTAVRIKQAWNATPQHLKSHIFQRRSGLNPNHARSHFSLTNDGIARLMIDPSASWIGIRHKSIPQDVSAFSLLNPPSNMIAVTDGVLHAAASVLYPNAICRIEAHADGFVGPVIMGPIVSMIVTPCKVPIVLLGQLEGKGDEIIFDIRPGQTELPSFLHSSGYPVGSYHSIRTLLDLVVSGHDPRPIVPWFRVAED